jgi:hypothetical protein
MESVNVSSLKNNPSEALRKAHGDVVRPVPRWRLVAAARRRWRACR